MTLNHPVEPPRRTSHIRGTVEGTALLINLCVFGICAWFAYARNINGLFFHFDGACTLIEIRNQLLLGAPLSFTNDYYQSIGNIQFLQSAEFLFFFWPIGWFEDLQISRLVAYLIIAAIVFLSAYGLARLLSLSCQVALVAGWVLGVLATPFVPLPFFYPILWVAPALVLMIPSPVIALWLLRAIGRSSVVVDVLAGLGLVGLALYLLSASPSILAVLGPGGAPYLVLAFLVARSRMERLRKLAVLAGATVVAIWLEWPWFLLGIFSQTAPNVVPADFTVVYQSPVYISIFFQGPAIGWAGPALVVMACLGAVVSLRRGAKELRSAARVLVAIILVLVAFRLLFLLFPRWIFPPPLYFEMAVWPLYGIFAAVAVHWLFGFLGSLLARVLPALRGSLAAGWAVAAPAVVVTALLATMHPPTAMDYPFPPRTTPIVEVLRANIALTAKSSFNGRVAAILPTKPDAGDPWAQQFATAMEHAKVVGNDEISAGLWFYQIPTLFEYNPFLSPQFHALVKRALQRPPTVHQRNITVLTHPDVRIMRLLGVRYLIMDEADDPPGERHASDGTSRQRWVLSELAAPNLATYSPTTLDVRRDFTATLDFLLDERNDLSRSAVVHRQIDGPLVPLQSSSLTMAGADLRIKARSSGRSLVIVPLEYSNCIELRNTLPGMSKAELLRVDGLLTGVIFEKEIDAVLAFRIGPLRNQSCRWRDYQELREMLTGR
jgi:hypothetical protein